MAENRLLRENNPEPGERRGYVPQHLETGSQEYSKTEGSDGRLHTKSMIVDQNGDPFENENPVPVQLTGSNRAIIETIADAEVVESSKPFQWSATDESFVYFIMNVDQSPWSLRIRDVLGSLYYDRTYPNIREETNTYSSTSPAIILPLGLRGGSLDREPASYEEAKQMALPPNYETVAGAKEIRVENHSSEPMTLTVKILRVWERR